jgi:SAM-dependent methyltransferase
LSRPRFSLRKTILCFSPAYRAWHSGISFEEEFWDSWMREKGGRNQWHTEFLSRCSPDLPLQQHITSLIDAPPGAEVHLLDVGAGPLTLLGKQWDGRKLHITAVDPLAEQYDRLLAKYRIEPPVRTIYAEAENLRATFSADHFDLVYAQNSIDHCFNPLRAIRQMLKVVKPGCYVFLAHSVKEGKRENYIGFHQWDFYAEGGELFISNRKEVINLTRRIDRIATVNIELFEDSWVNARIRKI